MRHVEKVYLFIHPLTYVDHEQEYQNKDFFNLALQYENKVCERWYEKISGMGENDILVLLPCRPETKSMRQLQDFSKQKLGERCIIVNPSKNDWAHQEFWQNLPNVFYEFVGKEVRDILVTRPSSLSNLDDLTTGIQAYSYVEDLRKALEKLKITIDAETVKAESWGESFEGCVIKYSQMMGKYLGLKQPVEVNFEMTVPDAVFLLNGIFLEKIILPDGIRLFLFKDENDIPIGTFFETFRQPSDEIRCVSIPVEPSKIRVFNTAGKEADVLNDPVLKVRYTDGYLQIQLVSGIYANGVFVFGDGYTSREFQKMMSNSVIVKEKPY